MATSGTSSQDIFIWLVSLFTGAVALAQMTSSALHGEMLAEMIESLGYGFVLLCSGLVFAKVAKTGSMRKEQAHKVLELYSMMLVMLAAVIAVVPPLAVIVFSVGVFVIAFGVLTVIVSLVSRT